MKKLLLAGVAALFSTGAFAQFGTAHDFTVTDIEGGTHHLYDILDQGYVVVLDASATWCGPCWGVHTAHYLRDLNNQMGPNGTNEIRVIFYEADASTTLADLQGTGSNTQGDWITGTNYPIVNESAPLSLQGSVYWPQGFPTINVIRPGDREITDDVWNQNLQGMIDAVNHAIATDPASIGNDWLTENGISVYPNPAIDQLIVNMSNASESVDGVVIRNMMGQIVSTISVQGQQRLEIEVASLTSGVYMIEFQNENSILGVQKFVKN
ncbi:MAG: T9SS type A sorting domain-containing protein [Flavobacteriales bacterium]|nr:T9SS type A sorting domain-containing protein [Flavobacteriales bacterium]MCB9191597.1 T9SS type A sorting domain-containing protein [Flavobacteriales bacterium]MCB9204412.1 T9SS type A sorting domain-containing protein [Flavobacteriales bacterium]